MLRSSCVILAACSAVLSASLACAAPDEWTVRKHLEVAGQPQGRELTKVGDEAYRFVCTDAGITSSTIVLVYRKGTDYFLKAADVDLHSYYGSNGKEGVEKTERKLTAAEWDGLQAKLKTLDYWTMPDPKRRLVLDGMNWTLEGATGPKYRTVMIASPDAGPYRATGLYLWRTSGIFMGYWADKQK